MRRRHNRHFYLDDDLVQCSGRVKFDGKRCGNWGKPFADGTFWCHIHLNQQPPPSSTDIQEGTGT